MAQKHIAAYSHGPSLTAHSAMTLQANIASTIEGNVPKKLQVAATLRRTLVKAINYDNKLKAAAEDPATAPDRDLAMEAMLPVISPLIPAFTTCFS